MFCKDMVSQKAVREHLSHYQMSWVCLVLLVLQCLMWMCA
ncbi:hypothetical protein CsSME_00004295 [Camellia sinensis var. sinensis]